MIPKIFAGEYRVPRSMRARVGGVWRVLKAAWYKRPVGWLRENLAGFCGWEYRTTGQTKRWVATCYGNGLFVSVSCDGAGTTDYCVATSPDGVTWTPRMAPVRSWAYICYGKGQFVALANGGATGGRLMCSSDGINWAITGAGIYNDARGIVYGNGRFMFCRGSGYVYYTSNPTGTWTAYGILPTINCICFNPVSGLFLVAGSDLGSYENIAWSTNGTSWAGRRTPGEWSKAIYANGRFVLSDNVSGTYQMTTSVDGSVWENSAYPERLKLLGYGNGAYIKGKADAEATLTTLFDPLANGIGTTLSSSDQVGSVFYAAGMFVANCFPQLTAQDGMWTSGAFDPWRWQTQATPANSELRSIAYGAGVFVAVGVSGARVMTSPDGITWTARTPANNIDWSSVCFGNGLFVAVSSMAIGNKVMTSPDGITWTSRTPAADNSWRAVCFGNNQFVAVAGSGTGNRVMTSPDGITWTSRTCLNNTWSSVCYGNGVFVAVATNSGPMTSTDGVTWTTRTAPFTGDCTSVCYGNGLFVVARFSGTGDRVMTSPDGITWTARTSAADNSWQSVCFGNNQFVAVAGSGTGNRVMTSSDGITWTSRTSAADDSWRSVCYGRDSFVAVAATVSQSNIMTCEAFQ